MKRFNYRVHNLRDFLVFSTILVISLFIRASLIIYKNHSDMEPPTKKKKDGNYKSNWELLYVCSRIGEKVYCLLCSSEFESMRSFNIKRHYTANHYDFEEEYPLSLPEPRMNKIRELKSNFGLVIQQKVVCNDNLATSTLVSFRVAYHLVKQRKPLLDGETFKEILTAVIRDMFQNTELEQRVTKFVDSLPLSRRTITRRVQSIGANLRSQLMEDLSRCEYFSFQLDESTNNANRVQVLVFLRLVFPDFSVREELFTTFSTKKPATAAEIFEALRTEFSASGIPLEKLAAITTDGSAIMTNNETGFIAKCKNHPDFPKFNSFHCALRQLTLCCKEITFDHIVDLVVNIVNSIIAKPLNARIYNVFKTENNSDVFGLSYFNEVKWLSKAIMLEKFLDNLENIKEFLITRGQEFPQLCDPQWINELAFIVDLTQILKHHIGEMQGNSKFFSKNFETLESLKLFLKSVTEIFSQNSVPFELTRLQKNVNISKENSFNAQYFSNLSQNLYSHMNNRFADITETQQIHNFLVNPKGNNTNSHNISHLIIKSHPVDASELPFEINRLQCDTKLAGIMSTGGDIWHVIAKENSYPNLLIVYKRISSFFATTYLCQSGFPHVYHIKSAERSVLSDRRLLDSLLISLSSFAPQLENLSKVVESQGSH